jgi:hypothetical protein
VQQNRFVLSEILINKSCTRNDEYACGSKCHNIEGFFNTYLLINLISNTLTVDLSNQSPVYVINSDLTQRSSDLNALMIA